MQPLQNPMDRMLDSTEDSTPEAAQQPPIHLFDLNPEILRKITGIYLARRLRRLAAYAKEFKALIKTNESYLTTRASKKLVSKLDNDMYAYIGRGNGDLLDHLLQFLCHRVLTMCDVSYWHIRAYGSEVDVHMEAFAQSWLWHRSSKHWKPAPPGWVFDLAQAIVPLAKALLLHYIAVYYPIRWGWMYHFDSSREDSLRRIVGLAEKEDLRTSEITGAMARKWYRDIREKRVMRIPEHKLFSAPRSALGGLADYRIADKQTVVTFEKVEYSELPYALNSVLGVPIPPHTVVMYVADLNWARY